MIGKREFNARFLQALNCFDTSLKHTSSGSNGRHPLLVKVLLDDAKSDIAVFGYERALIKWAPFIGCQVVSSEPAPESPQAKIEGGQLVMSAILPGRPKLTVDVELIKELRNSGMGWLLVSKVYRKRTGEYISKETAKRRYEQNTTLDHK